MDVIQLKNVADVNFVVPEGVSFFEPYLHYFTKEILEVGGEAYVARDKGVAFSGLFLYDGEEKDASIYTQSKEVFDYFYGLKSFNFVYAELKTELENEPYGIYTIDLNNLEIDHRFSYEITMADSSQTVEIERFMALTHPGINRRWVRVALKNGDKCFTLRLSDEIAGIGWLSLVNRVGRLHSLYVLPQYRKMRMGEDILNARLLWAKSKGARCMFSEISRSNVSCLRVAAKGQMKASGQVYQYFKRSPDKKK
jgi:GNAT superfamily N-acetyltransferase